MRERRGFEIFTLAINKTQFNYNLFREFKMNISYIALIAGVFFTSTSDISQVMMTEANPINVTKIYEGTYLLYIR